MAYTDLQYGHWYATRGGKVRRRVDGWWDVVLDDGTRQEGCDHVGFCHEVVGFGESAARVLARAVGGAAVKSHGIRFEGKTYEGRWTVRLGLGVEGEMALLSDEVGGLDE